MSENIKLEDIRNLLEVANITDFTGKFTALTGGEVNETFILHCTSRKIILRITKYSDVNTLNQEAWALHLLNMEWAPRLIYFDKANRIKGRDWILESYIEGTQPETLNLEQFEPLGRLLAQIHSIKSGESIHFDFWKYFLIVSKHFGDEASLLNHPDKKLNSLINRAYDYFNTQPSLTIKPSLIHGDVTLNNMLVNGDTVSLIDWEFSKYGDPMADFSTMFYEDMEYNKGKWRFHIKDREKEALFESYQKAGGTINGQRLNVWFNLDKLGAAVYLYWKLYQSGHDTKKGQAEQYELDLNNLIESLDRNI